MNKYEILREIFDVENISEKIVACPKITEEKLLVALTKDTYNLKIELGISATTISRYLTKLFPDRHKSTAKVDNYLLLKYGYKQCKHCSEVYDVECFYNNSASSDGLSAYCKPCQYSLEKPTSVARAAKYRAAKLQRSPRWVSLEELEEIQLFYSNCPDGFQVDHILPLQGEYVSGLHVLSNLQYLSIRDNTSKGNRFTPN